MLPLLFRLSKLLEYQAPELGLTQEEMGIVSRFRTAMLARMRTVQNPSIAHPLSLDGIRKLQAGMSLFIGTPLQPHFQQSPSTL